MCIRDSRRGAQRAGAAEVLMRRGVAGGGAQQGAGGLGGGGASAGEGGGGVAVPASGELRRALSRPLPPALCGPRRGSSRPHPPRPRTAPRDAATRVGGYGTVWYAATRRVVPVYDMMLLGGVY
eukprot:2860829-Rhodomonas_salina.1